MTSQSRYRFCVQVCARRVLSARRPLGRCAHALSARNLCEPTQRRCRPVRSRAQDQRADAASQPHLVHLWSPAHISLFSSRRRKPPDSGLLSGESRSCQSRRSLQACTRLPHPHTTTHSLWCALIGGLAPAPPASAICINLLCAAGPDLGPLAQQKPSPPCRFNPACATTEHVAHPRHCPPCPVAVEMRSLIVLLVGLLAAASGATFDECKADCLVSHPDKVKACECRCGGGEPCAADWRRLRVDQSDPSHPAHVTCRCGF